jgi:hypothetical protein
MKTWRRDNTIIISDIKGLIFPVIPVKIYIISMLKVQLCCPKIESRFAFAGI